VPRARLTWLSAKTTQLAVQSTSPWPSLPPAHLPSHVPVSRRPTSSPIPLYKRLTLTRRRPHLLTLTYRRLPPILEPPSPPVFSSSNHRRPPTPAASPPPPPSFLPPRRSSLRPFSMCPLLPLPFPLRSPPTGSGEHRRGERRGSDGGCGRVALERRIWRAGPMARS
jgi:hypothetical protein